MMENRNSNEITKIRKMGVSLFLVYIIIIICFYFLAGEQLHYRESRGEWELPQAESGTIELVEGTVVEQEFSAEIQRLEAVSVQWGTFYRSNAGIVTMELWDTRSNTILMSGKFDVSTIQEGAILTIESDNPIETTYNTPLLLRIYSDSIPGKAITPLMSATAQREGFALSYNGESVGGMLCFVVSGEDYIWTGLHYWTITAIIGLLLILLTIGELYLVRNNKHSYVLNMLTAIQKYRFLIHQLVARDFKAKYKRSILGVFWSFLNPLLMMSVQYFVFSTIFRNDIDNFAVYLLIGTVMFNFFSEACGMTLTSILGNASLITKVYMPKYIYPLTRVMSSVINLLISLIPLIIVCVLTGLHFHKSAVLALFFLSCEVIFSLGLGMLLSASMVFFRDTQFLWNVLSMIWMYATPIFYPESILASEFMIVLKSNPLYYFLKNTRLCILDGISPEPFAYFHCLLMAFGMLLIGAWIFRKNQDKFVLYL